MAGIFTLIVIGLSVGLGNFAASIAIGLQGIDNKSRSRVTIVFGTFETFMPIVGLIIGKQLSIFFGNHANLIGGTLLVLTGLYEINSSIRHKDNIKTKESIRNWRKLIITGLALSIDNLIVGFSLGAYGEPLILSAIVIGFISVSLSLLGLEIGKKLGIKVYEYSESISGVILMLVGLAISFKVI